MIQTSILAGEKDKKRADFLKSELLMISMFVWHNPWSEKLVDVPADFNLTKTNIKQRLSLPHMINNKDLT